MIRVNDVTPIRRRGGGVAQVPTAEPKTASTHGSISNDALAAAAKEFDSLLNDAVSLRASAIHIEPHGKLIQVRMRIDGLLRTVKELPIAGLPALVAHSKKCANLDADETRVPQDGRFDTSVKGQALTVRATLLPVADGEKVVLRVLSQADMPHDLQQLGYWGASLHALQDATQHPHGLILVSGPAGSGKTATLYGLLHMLMNPALNIATVEDNIEHRIPGINQTPVNLRAGMTFGSALRAVLHQDPNILMVSDLHDPEATGLALQAALAGRLVLAGIHTKNAAEAIAHVIAMHAEPYLLASATRVVTNQRLVRRLCTNCRQTYKPSNDEITGACKACGLEPANALEHIGRLQQTAATDLGVPAAKASSNITALWRANPKGCDECGGTGYKGRVALTEVMTINPAMQKLIFAGSGAAPVLYNQATIDGMVPLPMDGLVKTVLGITDLAELLRVVTQSS